MTDLNKLFETPSSKRDLVWEKSISEAFKASDVFLSKNEPFAGPDGFSYMSLSSNNGETLNKEDFLDWCYQSGVGAVLNLKEKKAPDYVLSYGMVWNYLLRGAFLNENDFKKDHQTEDLYIHEIAEGYLPMVVRDNIREFLKMNKIEGVKIALTSYGQGTPYEIHWSFGDFEADSPESETALLEAVSWFLPLDYRLIWSEEEPSLKFIDL